MTTSEWEKYRARKVIVTVPLGFLERHNNTLFTPPLPDAKLRAMQTLGMGTLNKVPSTPVRAATAQSHNPDVFGSHGVAAGR